MTTVLDHGFVDLVETWGSDERIIEAARESTDKGFLGWGPRSTCEHCGDPFDAPERDCPRPSAARGAARGGTQTASGLLCGFDGGTIMNARELVYKNGGRAPNAWACGTCGMIWQPKCWIGQEATAEAAANRCCNANCDDCGKPVDQPGWCICKPCRVVREQKKEAEAFANSKKVTLSEYDGAFVYCDGLGDDGYLRTEDVKLGIEGAISQGKPAPAYAWGTSENHASFDLVDTIESDVNDNHHESACDNVDRELLEAAQIIVDKALEDVVSYEADHKIAILLPKPIQDEDGFVVDWAQPEPTEAAP